MKTSFKKLFLLQQGKKHNQIRNQSLQLQFNGLTHPEWQSLSFSFSLSVQRGKRRRADPIPLLVFTKSYLTFSEGTASEVITGDGYRWGVRGVFRPRLVWDESFLEPAGPADPLGGSEVKRRRFPEMLHDAAERGAEDFTTRWSTITVSNVPG